MRISWLRKYLKVLIHNTKNTEEEKNNIKNLMGIGIGENQR